MLSKDEDDDSNERDPFTDRSFNFFDLEQDWGPSDRDIRHKFNFFGYFTLPVGLKANARVQARGAQPITPSPRILNGNDRGRNSERKDNAFFTLRLAPRAAVQAERRTVEIMPIIEMFNTFNNDEQHQPALHAGAVVHIPATAFSLSR